jgi:hypothetical protein
VSYVVEVILLVCNAFIHRQQATLSIKHSRNAFAVKLEEV